MKEREMRKRGWAALPVLVALTLVAAGCGKDKTTNTGQSNTTAGPTTTKPTFAAGSTMANLRAKGKIVVGTKFDQPGLGQKNPTTGKVEGFDVEMAKLIAVGLFGGSASDIESKIEFKESTTPNR